MSMLEPISSDSPEWPPEAGKRSAAGGQGEASPPVAPGDKNSFYHPWYRFALLLTGSEEKGLEILRETLEVAAGQLAEFRSTDSKVAWLLRTLAEKAQAALAHLPADEETPWAHVARLPDGERKAFALFQSFSLNVEKLAEFSGHRARFAELLAKARSTLAPDAYFPVDATLALHRPWMTEEPTRVARSVKKALAGGDKTRLPLEAQMAFDRQWHEALEAVQIPPGVELPDVMGGAASSLRGLMRQPAVLAIAVAFLVMIGAVCFTALQKMEEFPGRDIINELVASAAGGKGAGAGEAVDGVEAGSLEDWFLLKGFEGFVLPPELAKAKVESCQVFRFSGGEVAQLNLQERKAALFVFRTSDFGVTPDAGVWTIYQEEGNAIAIKREGPLSYVLTYHGDSREMNDLLRKLSQ